MNPQGNKPVKIVNTAPAYVADGHGLGINPENGSANLIFIQINPSQDPNAANLPEAEGSMVASVRMTLDQLKALNADITKQVASYKPKDKK